MPQLVQLVVLSSQVGENLSCLPIADVIMPQLVQLAVLSSQVCEIETYEPRHEKTNVLVSNLVRHKPGCTATEDS